MQRHFPVVLVLFAATSCANEPSMREPASPTTSPREAGEEHESKPAPLVEPGRKFEPEERWSLSDPSAVRTLKGTPFGEQEINEFWTRKGWRLTRKEERYMETVAELEKAGRIKKTAHWSQTPFNGVYEAQEPLTIAGTSIPAGTEFWMEFCENEDEVHLGRPLFRRTTGYEEEHQGHADQASDHRAGELRAGRERR